MAIFLINLTIVASLFLGNYKKAAPEAIKADMIVVEKEKRRLYLLKDMEILAEYEIALGGDPIGHKVREGDERTPEGLYIIDFKNPESDYCRALRISYPNRIDKARAARMGVAPGGDVMIHGIKKGWGWLGALHRRIDWTDGCIAVTNKEIKEIYKATDVGTPIEILP